MARLRDREARYQLSCRIMDSFQPSGFVSLSLISFDSPCLFSLRHLSPSFFLLHDIYLSSFLSTTSLFICLFLSLASVVTPQKRARPCLIMKRFRVSCRCALGTGAGEWKRLRKSKRERMLHDYGRGKTRRERKYELSLGTHREYSLSTRRRMAADHEARTIKPFCRKTPVITPHQPLRHSTDRLLLRRFSFRARFFSSLVFHSRLFRCSRFPHSNSPRWFPLASSLPFTFSTILLLFFFISFLFCLLNIECISELCIVTVCDTIVERHSWSRGNKTLRKRWYEDYSVYANATRIGNWLVVLKQAGGGYENEIVNIHYEWEIANE